MLNRLLPQCVVLTLLQLGPSQQDPSEAAANAQLSEFERCRKNCARLADQTREAIKERDELLNRGTKSVDAIKMSSASRTKLAALRAEAAKLESLYQAEKKKHEKSNGKKDQGLLLETQLSQKLQTVEVVKQHVEGAYSSARFIRFDVNCSKKNFFR